MDGRGIAFMGDFARSLQAARNYLVTETNAQTTGWDSNEPVPALRRAAAPGRLRQHRRAGANLVGYWHWHSLHYGQETYWKGVLGHDLEPNRVYEEVDRIGRELKRRRARSWPA